MRGVWCRCPASRLVMIGDRYLTDMVYGNRHGMLTVRPSPLTLAGETLAVRMVRPACWRRLQVLLQDVESAWGLGWLCQHDLMRADLSSAA